MITSTGVDICDTVREIPLMGVHQYNYKNGAFVDKIFKDTPIIKAFNIPIGSGDTGPTEKSILKAVRKVYSDASKLGADAGFAAVLRCTQEWMAFSQLFTNDAKSRGIYVPPEMFHTMNDDGTVQETHIRNDDGTMSVIQGSTIGVAPGAPEEFVKAQEKVKKMMSDASKNSSARVVYGSQFNPDAILSTPMNHEQKGGNGMCSSSKFVRQ